MAQTNAATFTNGSVMRHVTVTSFTASIGLMAIYAVDLIDLIFISMLGQDVMAAAAGYASTLMFFTSAINIGLAVAAGVLTARAIGAEDDEGAQEYATSAAIFVMVTSILVPAIVLPNAHFFLGLLGADGQVAELATTYIWIILPFTFVSGLSMVAVSFLRGYGENKVAMFPALLGAATNAILDPILIFGLSMGMEGAAWATVCARFVTLGLAIYPAIKRYNAFIRPRGYWLWRNLGEVNQLAIPAVLANIATPVGTAIITREMSKFGTDAIAGMAVIGRITPVAFSVILALAGSIGPILGQNYGAQRMDRVRQAYIDALKFVALYVGFVTLLLFLLREHITALFGATGMAETLILLYCFPVALASFFNGAVFVANASFSTMGRPSYATWFSWAQNTLGTFPFAYLGGTLYGAPGVLIGQASGSIFFAVIAMWVGFRVIIKPPDIRKKHRKHHYLLNHHNLVMHVLDKHGGS